MSVIEQPAENRNVSAVETGSQIATATVALIAIAVLVGGWAAGSDMLVRLRPNYAAMVPSTATFFLATSIGLFWKISAPANSRRTDTWLRIIAAAVAVISAANLTLILTGTAGSIDALFFPSFQSGHDAMSPATSMCFLLISACFAILAGGRKKTDFAYVTCATVGMLLAMIAVVGYAFDAKALYKISAFTSMALHTAIAFVILFVALLLVRPETGWLRVLLSERTGSVGARRLFPMILLVPFLFGLAALAASRANLIDLNFCFSLLSILTMVLLAAAVLHNATIENRAEQRLIAATEDLNVALADRDLLLRELYHRVKNNLQQINALIHMETAKTSDARAKGAFRATAGRVHALGTVHKLLISSASLSKLSTVTFFADLCENIGASFDAARQGITIDVDADDIPVAIDVAIPLGMLVNELVTNSLKHAFRRRPTGSITVRFKVAPDSSAALTITDDGIGIPDEKLEPSSSTSTGSRIIRSFVKQIRGEMTIAVDGGTAVSILIPSGFNQRGQHA